MTDDDQELMLDDDGYDQMSSSPSIHEEEIDFQYVYALRTFIATEQGQANAYKGDAMVLLNDANSYWWLVRLVKDSSVGFLPAEHIETPWERLARLNKHRNGDLTAPSAFPELAHNGSGNSSGSRMLNLFRTTSSSSTAASTNTDASRRKNGCSKSVTFLAHTTYLSASEYEYSDDEAEDEVQEDKEEEEEEEEEHEDRHDSIDVNNEVHRHIDPNDHYANIKHPHAGHLHTDRLHSEGMVVSLEPMNHDSLFDTRSANFEDPPSHNSDDEIGRHQPLQDPQPLVVQKRTANRQLVQFPTEHERKDSAASLSDSNKTVTKKLSIMSLFKPRNSSNMSIAGDDLGAQLICDEEMPETPTEEDEKYFKRRSLLKTKSSVEQISKKKKSKSSQTSISSISSNGSVQSQSSQPSTFSKLFKRHKSRENLLSTSPIPSISEASTHSSVASRESVEEVSSVSTESPDHLTTTHLNVPPRSQPEHLQSRQSPVDQLWLGPRTGNANSLRASNNPWAESHRQTSIDPRSIESRDHYSKNAHDRFHSPTMPLRNLFDKRDVSSASTYSASSIQSESPFMSHTSIPDPNRLHNPHQPVKRTLGSRPMSTPLDPRDVTGAFRRPNVNTMQPRPESAYLRVTKGPRDFVVSNDRSNKRASSQSVPTEPLLDSSEESSVGIESEEETEDTVIRHDLPDDEIATSVLTEGGPNMSSHGSLETVRNAENVEEDDEDNEVIVVGSRLVSPEKDIVSQATAEARGSVSDGGSVNSAQPSSKRDSISPPLIVPHDEIDDSPVSEQADTPALLASAPGNSVMNWPQESTSSLSLNKTETSDAEVTRKIFSQVKEIRDISNSLHRPAPLRLQGVSQRQPPKDLHPDIIPIYKDTSDKIGQLCDGYR